MTRDQSAYIISKNLGARLDPESVDMPRSNSEGRPVPELTDEQKYLFDTRGWLVIPGVLSEAEVTEMREFALRLHHDPESIPAGERTPLGGPLQGLCDHPQVVAFMNEFLAYPGLSSQECYGFRMESCNLFYRTLGDAKFSPHNGNGLFRFPGDTHFYHCLPGKAHSGLTRVVWELNPVDEGDGTLVVSGSHKSVFPAPAAIHDQHSSLWESYTCPAGSVLFFTEALTHSARQWTNPNRDRVAIFSCYNTVDSKWHDWDPSPELLAAMPPMRQTLFRPVRSANNLVGGHYHG